MPRIHPRSGRRAALPLVAALTGAVLAGCTMAPATVEGDRVQGLYNAFLIAAAGVFVVVAGLIGWSIVRYRARGSEPGEPVQTHGNVAIELAWWALPTLLVIGLFVASAVVLNTNDSRAADPAVQVRVTGSQWEWRFTFPSERVAVTGSRDAPPQLVLPVGRVIDFDLVSTDVIHSFFIPAFLVKRDLVPGIDNHLQLTIDTEGTYAGQCAEFCGLYHDEMRFTIRAVSPDEFARWLGAQPRSSQ